MPVLFGTYGSCSLVLHKAVIYNNQRSLHGCYFLTSGAVYPGVPITGNPAAVTSSSSFMIVSKSASLILWKLFVSRIFRASTKIADRELLENSETFQRPSIA